MQRLKQRNRTRTYILLTAVGAACLGATCSGTNTVSSPKKISVSLMANFGQASGSKRINAAREACPSTVVPQDAPNYDAGQDCDQDGGVVQYVTPQTFKVAVKRLAFLTTDGSYDLIADSGTLVDARVLDLTLPLTLDIQPPPDGAYPQFQAEIYYYEIAMPLYDANVLQTLRVYLSDDDFPAEGSRGHHQGDITLVGSDGAEIGFVRPGQRWMSDDVTQTRGDANGAGGTDPETGHLRGLFGDATLWNQAAFQQGSSADVYVMRGSLNLTVGSASQTVTFSFDVQDTWFYEDFNGNQLFDPCATAPGDACAEGAAWAPLFNKPVVEVTETPPDADTNDSQATSQPSAI